MENSKATLVLVFSFLFQVCNDTHKPSNRSQRHEKTISSSEQHETKVYIGNDLYQDADGKIYLKVKNRSLFHPSQHRKPRKDSIFLDRVNINEIDSIMPLKAIVDVYTFKKINDFGTYFLDSKRLYLYMLKPHPVQFFSLSRSDERFLDTKKDFLVHKGVLYYYGIKVEGLENENLSTLKYKKKSGGFYEFITDQKSVCYQEYPLDIERLSHFDLFDKDKKEIIQRFQLK